jgi:hypothetical protein
VPDVDTAEQVAAAILDYAEQRRATSMRGAGSTAWPTTSRRLPHPGADRRTRGRCPGPARARRRTAYAAAGRRLGAARRQAQDARRQRPSSIGCRTNAPRLAAAWVELAPHDPAALGFVCLRPLEALLTAVPSRTPPTSSSCSVRTRSASSGSGGRRRPAARRGRTADAPRQAGPTALSVLERPPAPVIRWRAAGGTSSPSGPRATVA